MADLIIGIGLVLVVEGLIWALFPFLAINLLEMAKQTPESQLRLAGTLSVLMGVILVWLVRG